MIDKTESNYTIKGVKITDILDILRDGSFMQVRAQYPNLTKADVNDVIDLAISVIDK